MATIIKLKTGTSTPSTSDLEAREVAIDTSAQKFYINDSGTIKEIGGGSFVLYQLKNVTVTSLGSGQILEYKVLHGLMNMLWRKGKVFTKTDDTNTIQMTNNKDMTTINGFLNYVVTQSLFMFTNTSGTAVTTIRPGHMPEISEL